MRKVLCIDDGCRPEDIKSQDWIEAGVEYTAVKVVRAIIKGNYGFILEEVSPNNPLYFGYSTSRFAISRYHLEEMMSRGEITVEDEPPKKKEEVLETVENS